MFFEDFKSALQQKFAGCIFDIDGTLTEIGEELIPEYLCKTLGELSLEVPMAVCSGRLLKGALKRVSGIFAASTDPEKCRKNWLIFVENGAIGYAYDAASSEYKEFFRATYPYSEEHRQQLFTHLCEVFQSRLKSFAQGNIGFNFSPSGYGEIRGEALAEECKILALDMMEAIKKFDPEQLLTAGASGIGVLVYPKNGSKDNGVREFGNFLRSKGFSVSKECREIVAVGDQPGECGNDRSFLNGTLGTPFTVGASVKNSLYPLAVYDLITRDTLKGAKATDYLVKNLRFVSSGR